MFKKIFKLNDIIRNLHQPVEYNLEPYRRIFNEINKVKLTLLSDARLKEMSAQLKGRAKSGESPDKLLVESFALVREVSFRVLGMRPFDVQVLVGIALHQGKMVEMQTGEGKTLAAVMPSYLNALTGQGAHVLTFNDYLARRDAAWMGPTFDFLGLTTSCVGEGMSIPARKKAYSSDITYVTAREAGFDYLRDFLCTEKKKLVHSPFHYAIVDEADSILIDEARIPLVIAGDVPAKEDNLHFLSRIVRELKPEEDYETDENFRNICLSEAGLSRVEKILGCGNLYAPNNLELLTRLNCALHAELLLKRDKDYLVRNGKIELIDEFTGRIADKRHWPDNLQAAVEAKEGLTAAPGGMVMGSIALQHFLNLYPRISGMTGTARSAAQEFYEFYGMKVVVIPTNKPCIRKDHDDMIFTSRETKWNALISEIKRKHETGQPILIGTGSVEESELLAADLEKAGIICRVLNAKNDEMEAKIIAGAGELKAVTVSTNMAGRGVDIRLGGEKEQERDKMVALGGLYVIGTNCHESKRIDDQLRGRAGRQGDPGESRFFLSLEDELFIKNDVAKSFLARNNLPGREGLIEDPAARRDLAWVQRVVEGYNTDTRRQLWKYSYIIEQQRRIIHKKRQEILCDEVSLRLLAARAADRYFLLQDQVGAVVLKKVEKQITLHYINKCWAEYLEYIAYIHEGIHLVVIGKQNPIDEFHKLAIAAFEEMLDRIDSEIVRTFYNVEINEKGIELDREGLKGPSSTWTYLIDDSPHQFGNISSLVKLAVTTINRPLFTVRSLYKSISTLFSTFKKRCS